MARRASKVGNSRSLAKARPKSAPRRNSVSRNTGMRVTLDHAQGAELRKLARERGTTVAAEAGNAIDCYILGINPADAQRLNAVLDRLNESTDRAMKAIDQALAATKKKGRRRRKTRTN